MSSTNITKAILNKGSKNVKKAYAAFNPLEAYSIEKAIKILKDVNYVKFNPTVELAVRLNIDTRKTDQNVRGAVVLPHGTGKSLSVCVLCTTEQFDEAKAAGADRVGNSDIVDEIKAGTIQYDVYIAVPTVIPMMSSVAKILGPKGLMPNPKLGTLTLKVAQAVKEAKAGKVEYRADKFGIVHAGIGKLDFDSAKLEGNINTVLKALTSAKPKDVKGKYMKSIFITSTMGPGIKIDPSTISMDKL